MGIVVIWLQDLKCELLWDEENKKFANIIDNECVKLVKLDKYDIIDGHSHFDTRHKTINVKAVDEEYIEHA